MSEIVFPYVAEFNSRNGYYPKPHGMLTMLGLKRITKSEYLLLDFLLDLGNTNAGGGGWFHCTDDRICSTKLLSSKTVVEARRGLQEKGLIDCKTGYSNHATEYKILIPKELYMGERRTPLQ